MSGRIFVISGPSGVGKGTLCRMLLAQEPGLRLSVSATSRPRRQAEVDGEDYFFKTREEFEEMIARNELLEWAEYNANYYGTPKAYAESLLARGLHVLLEIEVQGALQVKRQHADACLVFIEPPSMEELETRLRGRGTDEDGVIAQRLAIARQELAQKHQFDYCVANDDLDVCYQQLRKIITGEPGAAGSTIPSR